MAQVLPRRLTAKIDERFVVFLIGVRVNRLFAVRKWAPVVSAMPPMIRELEKDPRRGFLGAESFFYWRGAGVIQYWRSFEDLERFARDPDSSHFPAWRRFNQAIGSDGSVGIWHETYEVAQGRYEAIYNNMPLFGLAKATEAVSAAGRRETARRRLGGDNEPVVPSPEQPGTPAV